jgi:serine/threonine protein kinase
MTEYSQPRTLHERIYRILLGLYPAAFREEYGPLMVQLFRDMCRDARRSGTGGLVRLWLHTLFDLIRSALREHLAKRGGTMSIPTQIDNYEIKELLGTGGVSHIYRVHDPASGEDRALKVFRPDAAEKYKSFIDKQAHYLTVLDHPGIPACYDYVETDEHTYLVMDLIEGKDLLGTLTDTDDHLPVADVINWALDVCDILAYIHAHDPPLVVRDIKPRNLMRGDDGRIYLIDVGIIEEYIPGKTVPKIGTEGYAAPEQYKGLSDPRTDVFLVGATLHHLLTRRDPREHEPFTFAAVPMRDLNPAVPEALAAVVMQAIEMEPDDRFQSIVEMKAALQAAAAER